MVTGQLAPKSLDICTAPKTPNATIFASPGEPGLYGAETTGASIVAPPEVENVQEEKSIPPSLAT